MNASPYPRSGFHGGMYRDRVAAAIALARGRTSPYVSRLNAPFLPG
jgi:hypothetical protein